MQHKIKTVDKDDTV